MEDYKKMMKSHKDELRDLRAQSVRNIREVSMERDQLKKDLKKCEKNLQKNSSSELAIERYNEVSRMYENCQRELRELKMLRLAPQLSLVPAYDNRMVAISPRNKKVPSFLQDIVVFDKKRGLKGKQSKEIPLGMPSFLQGISSFDKSGLKSAPGKSENKKPSLLSGISSFNKSALRSKDSSRAPTAAYLKKFENKSEPPSFKDVLSSKFKYIKAPSEGFDSDVGEWDEDFSTKRRKSRRSARKTKAARRSTRKSKAARRSARKSKASRKSARKSKATRKSARKIEELLEIQKM